MKEYFIHYKDGSCIGVSTIFAFSKEEAIQEFKQEVSNSDTLEFKKIEEYEITVETFMCLDSINARKVYDVFIKMHNKLNEYQKKYNSFISN